MTDQELLEEYSRNRSERAFAELVERYVRLVHSACWRQLADAQLAEDATQSVFALLSGRAAKLRHENLAGWLLSSAHYTCANMKRADARRRRREVEVAIDQEADMNESPDALQAKSEILKVLDEALMGLKATDRAALALRFLQDLPIRQVGDALGLSEEAARKRVDRGLEKLRTLLGARGVTAAPAAIVAVLAHHADGPGVSEALTRRIVQTDRMTAVATPAMSVKAAIVACIAASAVLGATGWGLFKLMAGPAATGQVRVAPAVPAASAPATTQSNVVTLAPDLSTPNATLEYLTNALFIADHAAVYDCLIADPKTPKAKNVLIASLEEDLASRRLLNAGEKAYGPPGANLLAGEFPLEEALRGVVALLKMQHAEAEIDGTHATIKVMIPDAMIGALPPGMGDVLRAWNGKPIYFDKRGEAWMIDMNRSIRQVMIVQKQGTRASVQADDELACAILNQQAQDRNDIAMRIKSGELATVGDAQRAIQRKERELSTKFRVSFGSTYNAPADATP